VFWPYLSLVDLAQLSAEVLPQPPLTVLASVHLNCGDETCPWPESMGSLTSLAEQQLALLALGTIGDVCPIYSKYPGTPESCLLGIIVVVHHAVDEVQS